jgi:hypothetical protein
VSTVGGGPPRPPAELGVNWYWKYAVVGSPCGFTVPDTFALVVPVTTAGESVTAGGPLTGGGGGGALIVAWSVDTAVLPGLLL